MPDNSQFTKIVKHRQMLSVTLSDEDIRARGKQIAREIEEKHSAESEKKELSAEYSKKIQMHDRRIDQLSRVIDTGVDYQDVDIDIVYDFPAQELRKVRIDTGEVFIRRRMTDEESQLQLNLEIEEAEDPELPEQLEDPERKDPEKDDPNYEVQTKAA